MEYLWQSDMIPHRTCRRSKIAEHQRQKCRTDTHNDQIGKNPHRMESEPFFELFGWTYFFY
jgi:hypothetical protein